MKARPSMRTINEANAITTMPACQFLVAKIKPTIIGMISPPKLLPIVVMPITRPRFFGNQIGMRRPAGKPAAPEKLTNCMKLSVYQCHSSVISGRRMKLNPNRNIEPVIMSLAPCLSISRPSNGPTRLPTAMNDRDPLILVRSHPKSFSKGSMNRLKA